MTRPDALVAAVNLMASIQHLHDATDDAHVRAVCKAMAKDAGKLLAKVNPRLAEEVVS